MPVSSAWQTSHQISVIYPWMLNVSSIVMKSKKYVWVSVGVREIGLWVREIRLAFLIAIMMRHHARFLALASKIAQMAVMDVWRLSAYAMITKTTRTTLPALASMSEYTIYASSTVQRAIGFVWLCVIEIYWIIWKPALVEVSVRMVVRVQLMSVLKQRLLQPLRLLPLLRPQRLLPLLRKLRLLRLPSKTLFWFFQHPRATKRRS